MLSVRRVLIGLALVLTVYLVLRALVWTSPIAHPWVLVGGLAAHLAVTWVCLFTPGKSVGPGVATTPLPIWASVLALVMAAGAPTVTAFAAGPESLYAPYATVYIGGIGALMTIVVVRRRPIVAWVGTALLAVGASVWLGVVPALSLGLVGSIVWVIIADLVMRLFARAARDTERLAEVQRAASSWQVSQVERQRERRVRVQTALTIAGPVLTKVVASGGALTDEERIEARLAEGRLRDELRGARLLDDDVRAAFDVARRRGAQVTVLDEGGLDDLDSDALTAIRAELARTVHGASSDRLIVRTSTHPGVALTVVGRSGEGLGLSDEDHVDLWHEIPRR